MTVVINLAEIRQKRGLSQNQLARSMEMSVANIQKMESNHAKSIPLSTLDKLTDILECEVGDIIVKKNI